MKRILTAAFLSLAAIVPASAACISVEQFNAQMAAVPDWSVRELTGIALKTAAEFYNALPPVSGNEIGTAYLVDRNDGGGFLVVGPQGAVCGAVSFDASRWQAVRRMLEGPPA